MDGQHDWISGEFEAVERDALGLLDTAAARRACDAGAMDWKRHVGADEATLEAFDGEFRQAAFAAALRAVNNDPHSPKIHAVGRFEHQLASGETAPSTNFGHGNPDTLYRLIPVEPRSSYRITGRFPGPRTTATEISLVDATQGFLGNIGSRDLAVDEDGRFSVILSPEPPARVGNALQNHPGAYTVCIRDVIGDFQSECPPVLEVEWLGPAGAGVEAADPERDFATMLERLIVDTTGFETRTLRKIPVNTFSTPDGGMGTVFIPSQAFSLGRYELEDDQAIVFRVSMGGASYFALPANNLWGGFGDFFSHVGALNNFRAVPDEDGDLTFALSLADPGVTNWIDPGGARLGFIGARWSGFRGDQPTPKLSAALVDLSNIDAVVGKNVARCDGAGRARQRVAYRSSYLRVK